jgi:hypothetical protein
LVNSIVKNASGLSSGNSTRTVTAISVAPIGVFSRG